MDTHTQNVIRGNMELMSEDGPHFITWMDSRHEEQVAVREGHPSARTWKWNGSRYQTDELMKLIGVTKVAPLHVAKAA